MKIKSKKNIKKNRKHSGKNIRKNKRSGKNIRKNVMRVSEQDFQDNIKRLTKKKPSLTTLNINNSDIDHVREKELSGILNSKKKHTSKKDKQKFNRTKIHYGGNDELLASCPMIGYINHAGECWNDTLMTIICFSDGRIGKKVQNFFKYIHTKIKSDKTNTNPDKLIRELLTNYDNEKYRKKIGLYLLPLNVNVENPDNMLIFQDNAIKYIIFMYRRFMNNIAAKSAQIHNQENTLRITRQISEYTSVYCTMFIYNISNININKKNQWNRLEHGGNTFTTHIVLCIINYFIMTIQNDLIISVKENNKSIALPIDHTNIKSLDPKEMNLITNSSNLFLYNEKNYQEFVIDNILKDSIVALLTVAYPNTDKTHTDKNIMHSVAYFKCNNKSKYYNDNADESGNLVYQLDVDWKKTIKKQMVIYNTTKKYQIFDTLTNKSNQLDVKIINFVSLVKSIDKYKKQSNLNYFSNYTSYNDLYTYFNIKSLDYSGYFNYNDNNYNNYNNNYNDIIYNNSIFSTMNEKEEEKE